MTGNKQDDIGKKEAQITVWNNPVILSLLRAKQSSFGSGKLQRTHCLCHWSALSVLRIQNGQEKTFGKDHETILFRLHGRQ